MVLPYTHLSSRYVHELSKVNKEFWLSSEDRVEYFACWGITGDIAVGIDIWNQAVILRILIVYITYSIIICIIKDMCPIYDLEKDFQVSK